MCCFLTHLFKRYLSVFVNRTATWQWHWSEDARDRDVQNKRGQRFQKRTSTVVVKAPSAVTYYPEKSMKPNLRAHSSHERVEQAYLLAVCINFWALIADCVYYDYNFVSLDIIKRLLLVEYLFNIILSKYGALVSDLIIIYRLECILHPNIINVAY